MKASHLKGALAGSRTSNYNISGRNKTFGPKMAKSIVPKTPPLYSLVIGIQNRASKYDLNYFNLSSSLCMYIVFVYNPIQEKIKPRIAGERKKMEEGKKIRKKEKGCPEAARKRSANSRSKRREGGGIILGL